MREGDWVREKGQKLGREEGGELKTGGWEEERPSKKEKIL